MSRRLVLSLPISGGIAFEPDDAEALFQILRGAVVCTSYYGGTSLPVESEVPIQMAFCEVNMPEEAEGIQP